MERVIELTNVRKVYRQVQRSASVTVVQPEAGSSPGQRFWHFSN